MEDTKNKTISTIDVNIAYDFRQQFMDDLNNCPLCGTELLITQVTHFIDQEVTEEAHCEACKIRTRNNKHRLQ